MYFRLSFASRTLALAAILTCVQFQMKADTLPPTVPVLLSATAASCGQVNLAWTASVDEIGGSGVKGYAINRNDGVVTTIGAARTSFSDTNTVRSSSSWTYTVAAIDN